MLSAASDSRLLVVDCQERLAPHVTDGDTVISQCANLIGAARILEIPVLAPLRRIPGRRPTSPGPPAAPTGSTSP